jgi:hypothetical protein
LLLKQEESAHQLRKPRRSVSGWQVQATHLPFADPGPASGSLHAQSLEVIGEAHEPGGRRHRQGHGHHKHYKGKLRLADVKKMFEATRDHG